MSTESDFAHSNILDKTIKYAKEIDDLIYLLYCAVNEIDPELSRVETMDLDVVYGLASFHSVASMVAFALERVIELPQEYDQTKKKAIRKLALFDVERKKLFSCFDREKNGICH